jgi:hypothetical protein
MPVSETIDVVRGGTGNVKPESVACGIDDSAGASGGAGGSWPAAVSNRRQ